MQDKKTIQIYVNNFRRQVATYLKPGFGLSFRIFPVKAEGAILEFSLATDAENEDQYMPVEETVNVALSKIKQNMISGNLDAIKFSGTNISMEPGRIVLIKGEDLASEWCEKGATNDVERIVTPPPKG